MICPYCNKEAEWVPNERVYNGKRYGTSYMMYVCFSCDARVGTHQNTKKPLGTMANKELRTARIAAHANIDPLWKSENYKRSEIYQALSVYFGFSVHIGESDLVLAKLIAELDVHILRKLIDEPTLFADIPKSKYKCETVTIRKGVQRKRIIPSTELRAECPFELPTDRVYLRCGWRKL